MTRNQTDRRAIWTNGIRIVLGVLLCALPLWVSVINFQTAEDASDGLDSRQLVEAFWLWQFLFLAVFVLVLPISPRSRFLSVTGLSATYLLLGLLCEVDGFSGDRWPLFRVRFTTPVADDVETLAAAPVQFRIAEDDYPGFRGRNASGMVSGRNLATSWQQQTPQQIWHRSIGAGWSSFAIAGGLCVTQEQRGGDECIVAYQLKDGVPVWLRRDPVRFEEPMGGAGPRATPSIAAGRVVALGATGLLTCLDASTGDLQWQVDVLDGSKIPTHYGLSASPLVVDNQVFVAVGGSAGTLVAFDLRSGRCLWKQGNFPGSYSSPQLWQASSGKAILLFHGDGLSSFDFASGRVQWTHPWRTNPPELNNVCQPVPLPISAPDRRLVFISSGYGEGSALLEISDNTVRERWWNTRLKAKFSSVVMLDGHVYGLDDRKLVCLELATGKEKWRGGRFGYGQLMLIDRQLVIMSESGMVSLVAASPQSYQPRGRFRGLRTRTWNHPALSGNWLVIRNDRQASCWRLPLAP